MGSVPHMELRNTYNRTLMLVVTNEIVYDREVVTLIMKGSLSSRPPRSEYT